MFLSINLLCIHDTLMQASSICTCGCYNVFRLEDYDRNLNFEKVVAMQPDGTFASLSGGGGGNSHMFICSMLVR